MGTSMKRSTYAYTILEKEDPEEVAHKRAQWMIAKLLKQADGVRRTSTMGVRICRLRIRLGRRLKKLRKSVQLSWLVAKARLCRRAAEKLKVWRQMLRRKGAAAVGVPLPLSLLEQAKMREIKEGFNQ